MHEESKIAVNEKLEVNIIRKPAITGPEENHLEVTLSIIHQDEKTGVRLPGFAFMRGGRSIGVYGPPPDYESRWNTKRRKSKRQAIEGLPMLVVVNGDNVLGDPVLHEEFFDRVWLTEDNSIFSAIGLLSFATLNGTPSLSLYENSHATHKLSNEVKSHLGCA